MIIDVTHGHSYCRAVNIISTFVSVVGQRSVHVSLEPVMQVITVIILEKLLEDPVMQVSTVIILEKLLEEWDCSRLLILKSLILTGALCNDNLFNTASGNRQNSCRDVEDAR